MIKYFLLGALTLASWSCAQNYPYHSNGYPQDGYYQNDSWGYDDDFYSYAYNNFPDSYYYEYPVDYYPSAYYQSYYNDYRQSIMGVNWDRFFMEFNLNQAQIQQIMMLNRRFSSYGQWSSFYAMNPDRWYYDRFYALQQILGPRIFIVFQNRYYQGYSPVAYWQNYRRTYYVPRYQPIQRYRSVNVRNYYVDRDRYFRDYGSRYGYNTNRTIHSPGGLSDNANRNTSRDNWNTTGSRQDAQRPGFRTNTNESFRATPQIRNNGGESRTVPSTGARDGFRSGSGAQPQVMQNRSSRPAPQVQSRDSGGFRSGSGVQPEASQRRSDGTRAGGGFR